MGRLEETLRDLNIAASRSSSVLVAYSGGKDALATMDLCVRTFKRVEAFFMYLVPDLEHVEAMLDFARKTWGVNIRQYPHFSLPKLLNSGAYCPSHYSRDNLPEFRLAEVYGAAMQDANIHMIATGAKKSDSLFRRKSWHQFEKDYLVYPLREWSTRDVLGYLNLRKLPVATKNEKHQTSGVDLTTRDLLRIHDQFPADFDRMERVFPYIRAVVKRRDWYGVIE